AAWWRPTSGTRSGPSAPVSRPVWSPARGMPRCRCRGCHSRTSWHPTCRRSRPDKSSVGDHEQRSTVASGTQANIISMEERMSHPDEYDAVVLGSGAAGNRVSWTLAAQGKCTAVVERRYVGGSCPNIACLPSKNVIHAAKVADFFRRGAEFGIANGGWKVEMAAVRDRKRT